MEKAEKCSREIAGKAVSRRGMGIRVVATQSWRLQRPKAFQPIPLVTGIKAGVKTCLTWRNGKAPPPPSPPPPSVPSPPPPPPHSFKASRDPRDDPPPSGHWQESIPSLGLRIPLQDSRILKVQLESIPLCLDSKFNEIQNHHHHHAPLIG